MVGTRLRFLRHQTFTTDTPCIVSCFFGGRTTTRTPTQVQTENATGRAVGTQWGRSTIPRRLREVDSPGLLEQRTLPNGEGRSNVLLNAPFVHGPIFNGSTRRQVRGTAPATLISRKLQV